MQFLTDFADQAVILPAVALVCLALFATGWRRGALALAGSAGGVIALIAAGKIALKSCAALSANLWGLHSPSGHTAMGALVFGGLMAMMLASRLAVWPAVWHAGVAATVIGGSRVVLGMHTVADVLVGSLVGIGGVCAMVAIAGPIPNRPLQHRTLVPVALGVAFLFHGQHLAIEEVLDRYARSLRPPSFCRLDPTEAGREIGASRMVFAWGATVRE